MAENRQYRSVNSKTLHELATKIRVEILKDVLDGRTRELGAKIIGIYNVPARDNEQLARAFQLYAQSIKFFREVPEIIAAPWVTAEWGIGDCDDKSRLIASLLKSFRIPVRLHYVTFDTGKKKLSHVWPEAQIQTDGPWVALESVQPWPMGRSALAMIQRKNFRHSSFFMEI